MTSWSMSWEGGTKWEGEGEGEGDLRLGVTDIGDNSKSDNPHLDSTALSTMDPRAVVPRRAGGGGRLSTWHLKREGGASKVICLRDVAQKCRRLSARIVSITREHAD
jgi:hypothetical protein